MPFPAFVAAGALATNVVNQTLPLVAPACRRDDILIAQVINKALTVAISPPDATWQQLYQADADCTTRYVVESSAGNDCTLCCTSGNNDGTNIASRTWATASTTDAGSTALVVGLVATPVLPNNYQSVRADSGISVGERIR